MSMAIAHFAIGVSFAVLFLKLTNNVGHRLQTIPIFTFGLLAFIPDLHHVIPIQPIADTAYQFHTSVYANVFFLHHAVDSFDVHNTKTFAAFCILIMVISLATLWKEQI